MANPRMSIKPWIQKQHERRFSMMHRPISFGTTPWIQQKHQAQYNALHRPKTFTAPIVPYGSPFKSRSYRGFSNLRTTCPYQGAFAGYGEILQLGSSTKLEPGKEYTVTVQFKNVLMPSESFVYEKVAASFGKFAAISALNRGLFSNSFIITFTPNSQMGINSTAIGIRNAFLPDYDANVVQIETGKESTKPGGAAAAVKSVTKKIVAVPVAFAQGATETLATGASNVATGILKGAWPVLAIGATGVFVYLYVASGAAKRRVGRMR